MSDGVVDPQPKSRMSLWLPILICVVCGVGGNLTLKWGMQGYQPEADKGVVVQLILRILTSPVLIGGLVLYGVSMLSWLRLISTQKLSFVYPVFVSMSFMLVMSASAYIFHEQVKWTQAVGCVVIVTGIWLATR
jgi:multidrug transporter EmrE-like cation transporter